MLSNQALELAHEPRVQTERKLRLASALDRRQPKLFQPAALQCKDPVLGDVSERAATPQCESASEPFGCCPRQPASQGVLALAHELLETLRVDLQSCGLERIAASTSDHAHVGAEERAQARDVRADGHGGARRRPPLPEFLDQATDGDDAPGLKQEQRQHRPLLRSTKRHLGVRAKRLQRAEDTELQARRVRSRLIEFHTWMLRRSRRRSKRTLGCTRPPRIPRGQRKSPVWTTEAPPQRARHYARADAGGPDARAVAGARAFLTRRSDAGPPKEFLVSVSSSVSGQCSKPVAKPWGTRGVMSSVTSASAEERAAAFSALNKGGTKRSHLVRCDPTTQKPPP